jgi:hypothetical protein
MKASMVSIVLGRMRSGRYGLLEWARPDDARPEKKRIEDMERKQNGPEKVAAWRRALLDSMIYSYTSVFEINPVLSEDDYEFNADRLRGLVLWKAELESRDVPRPSAKVLLWRIELLDDEINYREQICRSKNGPPKDEIAEIKDEIRKMRIWLNELKAQRRER